MGQSLLKAFAFLAQRKPEIQRGGDGGGDFVLVKDPACVGNGRLPGQEWGALDFARRFVAGAVGSVGETREIFG